LLSLLLRAGPAPGGEPASAPAASEPSPSWDFVVELPELGRGQLAVTWTLRGFGGKRPLRVCADMDGGERYVTQIELKETKKPLPRDGECWRVPEAEPRGVVLSYTYDLRGLANQHASPDYAQLVGDTYIFNDEAVLLRPEPMPQRTASTPAPAISVDMRLPAGAKVVAPWQRQPGPGWRFSYDGTQYDSGSYVTVGALEDLGAIQLSHTTLTLVTLPGPRRLSAEALRRWARAAMTAVEGFYGTLTPPQVLLNLVPVPGSREPSLFGTVLRPPHPSAVIYYGGDCEQAETPDEWVAVHELFHIANPILTRKIHWLTEGFTTYYQDVLRARAGMLGETAAWADLWDGFRRFCQPTDGLSIKDESERLRSTHRYPRVYWGGACVAFMADVAIRERSQGKHSLDDLLRELRVASLREPLSEDEIVAALDRAAGGKLVSSLLRERRAIAVRERLQRLGVEMTGPQEVRLRDDSPQSALRKAIFQPR
jgi:hypothetical protein